MDDVAVETEADEEDAAAAAAVEVRFMRTLRSCHC